MPPALSEFAQDLNLAVKAWRTAPFLPLFSCVIALLQAGLVSLDVSDSPPLALLGWLASLALGFFWLGSLGTERLWYLKAFREEPFGLRLALLVSLRFVGRFFRLGLAMLWRFAILWLLIVVLFIFARRGGGSLPLWYYAVTFLLGLPMSAILTFAAPALVYTTRSASEAIRAGFDLVRTAWPDTVPYILLPPLALVIFARSNLQQYGAPTLLAATVVYTLLNLVFKGAAALFFLRRFDVVDEALPREAVTPPSGPEIVAEAVG